MSSMETINDEIQPNPETPADPAKMQAKRVFIGFAATITIGLTVAGWYVGGRIFAAEKVHAAIDCTAGFTSPSPSADDCQTRAISSGNCGTRSGGARRGTRLE